MKKPKKQISEDLLASWLAATAIIRNERIVEAMTFREICVCNILYNNRDTEITATDVINETGMLKSQVNKVLTDMEDKNLISRVRSNDDKRRILLSFTPEGYESYENEHEKILKILTSVVDTVGEKEAERLSVGILKIANIINTFEKGKKSSKK